MQGYTKLFSSMIHSTIWREPNHVRIVWVTMLAMAGRDGIVEASVPGLADAARVTVDECKDALRRLAEPDPDSRSKDKDGRRILELDGGWEIVNHRKYREKLSKEDMREKTAIRVARYRERKRNEKTLQVTEETHVTRSDASNHIASPSPSPEAKSRGGESAREPDPPTVGVEISTGARRFTESLNTEAPDFLQFTEQHRDLAKANGLDINHTWLECRDKRRAKGYRCASWEAEFTSWLRTEAKFKRERDKRAQPEKSAPPVTRYRVLNPSPLPPQRAQSKTDS
jgi:hypothetical protein